MLKHGDDSAEFEEIKTAANGVFDSRLLLDGTDHVTPLVKKAAAELRTNLTAAHTEFTKAHEQGLTSLSASDAWQQVDGSKQTQILSAGGLANAPSIAVGTDEELLGTLDSTPLSSWADKTAALASRFSDAATKAARELEPKLQRVHLSSGTLKTEDEVKAWLAEQEVQLIARLGEGPIVIA